nr:reverse transcriptase domain-containing protein [Tanacetum cinerariifolium]
MNNNQNQEPPAQNGLPLMVRPNGQAPRTIEELCQSSINVRGGLIAPIQIQATDFGLRHPIDMKCETSGSPYSFTKCLAVGGYTQETAYATTGTGSLPSNTIPNPQEDLKVITTRSGVTLAGPSVSPSSSSKEVDLEPEMITDQSSNPTPISNLIIALSSPSLTPFEGGDFILEDIKAYLTSESIPPGIDDTDLDLKGDIHHLEELLNNDPSFSPLPPKELNVEEIKTVKSSIDEPSKLELKELPSHLEYAYLEGADKLPVIIEKDLKVDEKEALLK